jgi:hypothetical protein
MNKQTGAKVLFVFFLSLLPLWHQNSFLSPATIVENLKTETLSQQPEKSPHTELEGTHFNLSATGFTFIQKMFPRFIYYHNCFL